MNKPNIKVIFTREALESFTGTQEELDQLIQEIVQAVENEDLEAVEFDEDEEIEIDHIDYIPPTLH